MRVRGGEGESVYDDLYAIVARDEKAAYIGVWGDGMRAGILL